MPDNQPPVNPHVNPFTEVNGDKLTDEQILKRKKMIEEILHRLLTTDCCRQTADWQQRVHQLTYKQLEKRYRNLFGRSVIMGDQ